MTVYVRAQILRWVSDDFPGFVECMFADSSGREWSIIEKASAVSGANLRSNSQFPQTALIACNVVASGQDDGGREIAHVTTITPFAIEAADGTTSFQLYAEQLQVSDD